MWINRQRQEELLSKLDTQNATLAQLHLEITELRRQADEQKANRQQSDSAWAERVASLQARVNEYEQLRHDAEIQQLKIEELTNVIRGLERGVTGSKTWHHLPPDNIFWQTTSEMTHPFVIPFTPDMQVMLWIAHSSFPMLPLTSIILPRSYASRAFVRIPEPEGGDVQASPIPETNVDILPIDGYIALRLDGYAAPPKWIDTLLAFKAQQDLNMWLVWFEEDTSASANAGIRVAVACPKRDFKIEPKAPPEWREKQVIYFEPHPSYRMSIPIPRTPIIADDPSDSEARSDHSSEAPAN